jgi:hypothetical protein
MVETERKMSRYKKRYRRRRRKGGTVEKRVERNNRGAEREQRIEGPETGMPMPD